MPLPQRRNADRRRTGGRTRQRREPDLKSNFLSPANEQGADESGWAFLGADGNSLTKIQPDFDQRFCGRQSVSELIWKYLEVLETSGRAAPGSRNKVVYAKVIGPKDPAKRGREGSASSSESESRQVCRSAIRRRHVCANALRRVTNKMKSVREQIDNAMKCSHRRSLLLGTPCRAIPWVVATCSDRSCFSRQISFPDSTSKRGLGSQAGMAYNLYYVKLRSRYRGRHVMPGQTSRQAATCGCAWRPEPPPRRRHIAMSRCRPAPTRTSSTLPRPQITQVATVRPPASAGAA